MNSRRFKNAEKQIVPEALDLHILAGDDAEVEMCIRDRQFAPWSCVSFRGVPLDTWAKTDERFRFDREALQKESIGGGWVTLAGKFCTEYGIATTAARMAYAVLHLSLIHI